MAKWLNNLRPVKGFRVLFRRVVGNSPLWTVLLTSTNTFQYSCLIKGTTGSQPRSFSNLTRLSKITEFLHLCCRLMVVVGCGAVVEQTHIFFQCFLDRNVYLCFILPSPMLCEVSDLLCTSTMFTGNPERSDLLSILQLTSDWHFCMSGLKTKLCWSYRLMGCQQSQTCAYIPSSNWTKISAGKKKISFREI